MDFKQFKKVGDDEKTITLRHDKGHEVRIVKSALDPKMRKALSSIPSHEPENYADGGEIEDPTKSVAAEEPPIASDAQTGEPVAPSAQPPVTINITQPGAPSPAPAAEAPPEPSTAQKVGQAIGSVAKYTPLGIGLRGGPLPEIKQAAEAVAPYVQQAAEGVGAGITNTPLQPPPQPAAAPAPAVPQPEASLAPAPPPSELPSPADMAAENYQKALGLGMQGIGEQAKAETDLSKAKQDISHEAAESTATLENELRTKLQENGDEVDAVTNDIQEGHIDPNHYLESRTSGQKIGHFIGLILGGIGGGLTHTDNPVLGLINQQINRDIKAQQSNLDKKNNLLAALMHKEGNIRAATDMFRVIRANTIAHQLDEAAAAAGTPMAKARADQAKAQLLQQYAPVLMKSSLMSAVSKLSKSGDADAVGKMLPQLRVYDPAMAKELEGRYVPGLGLASVPLDTKTRDTLEARNTLQERVHALREFARQHEGTVLDRAAVNYGETLAKTVQDAYRRANGQGVFKESEAKFINSIVSEDPTAFLNKIRVDPKLKALEDSNRAELNGLRKSVGLPVSQPAAEVRTMNGVPYVRVDGGWKRKQ